MIAGIGKAVFEGLRVLFLEDEALVRMSHAEILQDLGCRVTIAEALAAIQHEAFDLGLLDVNIGEADPLTYRVAQAKYEPAQFGIIGASASAISCCDPQRSATPVDRVEPKHVGERSVSS